MSDVDHELIAQVVRLFEAEGLTELVIEEPGLRIAVRRDAEQTAGAVTVPEAPAARPRRGARDQERAAEPEDLGQTAISSPISGVFYRSSSPGGRPYVQEGDEVEEGQIVGIVEAMKVMNEITTHLAGVVRRIVAKNEDLVAVGQVLMWLEPL